MGALFFLVNDGGLCPPNPPGYFWPDEAGEMWYLWGEGIREWVGFAESKWHRRRVLSRS